MNPFKKAVTGTNGISAAYCRGLRALKAIDQHRISAISTRSIQGSVDIDTSLKPKFPQSNRWDYAIGYKRSAHGHVVYWVEVHPASPGDVKIILAKLDWLLDWLKESNSPLSRVPREFIWVSSGKTILSPRSPEVKKLASRGVRSVGRHLHLS